MMDIQWTPSDWRSRPAWQLPDYKEEEHLKRIEAWLAQAPALVCAEDVSKLKNHLAEVAAGRAFLVQGGDCAETFSDMKTDALKETYTIFQLMAAIFARIKPVLTLGRMAGQFAKPRSSLTERRDDVILPSYRGDAVNQRAFTETARTSQPERLLQAYEHSVKRLGLLHRLAAGHRADQTWHHKALETAFIKETVLKDKIMACLASLSHPIWPEGSVYISHEALLLGYEEALTRRDPKTGLWTDMSAHMLWIGDRTRQLDGAHVDFARGVHNPIGVKCGPSLKPDELLSLMDCLDPYHEPGRLTLIIRLGVEEIAEHLPRLARKVKQAGHPAIWCCDPMHGNTYRTQSGYKTRRMEDIVSETCSFIDIVHAEGLYPGGLHVEMTGIR